MPKFVLAGSFTLQVNLWLQLNLFWLACYIVLAFFMKIVSAFGILCTDTSLWVHTQTHSHTNTLAHTKLHPVMLTLGVWEWAEKAEMMPPVMGVGPCRMLSSSSTWGSAELRIVAIHKSEPGPDSVCCGAQRCWYSDGDDECQRNLTLLVMWWVESWSERLSELKGARTQTTA